MLSFFTNRTICVAIGRSKINFIPSQFETVSIENQAKMKFQSKLNETRERESRETRCRIIVDTSRVKIRGPWRVTELSLKFHPRAIVSGAKETRNRNATRARNSPPVGIRDWHSRRIAHVRRVSRDKTYERRNVRATEVSTTSLALSSTCAFFPPPTSTSPRDRLGNDDLL